MQEVLAAPKLDCRDFFAECKKGILGYKNDFAKYFVLAPAFNQVTTEIKLEVGQIVIPAVDQPHFKHIEQIVSDVVELFFDRENFTHYGKTMGDHYDELKARSFPAFQSKFMQLCKETNIKIEAFILAYKHKLKYPGRESSTMELDTFLQYVDQTPVEPTSDGGTDQTVSPATKESERLLRAFILATSANYFVYEFDTRFHSQMATAFNNMRKHLDTINKAKDAINGVRYGVQVDELLPLRGIWEQVEAEYAKLEQNIAI